MLSANYFEYNLGSFIHIPVNKELVTSVEFKDSEDTLRQTITFTDNGNQNQKIGYASFNTASLAYTITKAVIIAGGRTDVILNLLKNANIGSENYFLK